MNTKAELLELSYQELPGDHNTPDYRRKALVVKWDVSHNNSTTTLSQVLTLTKNPYKSGWEASISMDDFPDLATPTEAAHKLADWMKRLAQVIESEQFDIIDLAPEANTSQQEKDADFEVEG